MLFKSPTCTQRDKRMAERLARIAGIDLDRLGREMFSAASSAEKPVETLLNTDFKEFHIAGHALGISQITCLEPEALLARMDELLSAMNKLRQLRGYDMVLLMVTDVLRCGTELIFLGDEEIIEQAFNTGKITGQHVFLPGVVSRKKQIVPALAALWG